MEINDPQELVGGEIVAVSYDKTRGLVTNLILKLTNGHTAKVNPGYCREYDECLYFETLPTP
jgi:hypothetical protein